MLVACGVVYAAGTNATAPGPRPRTLSTIAAPVQPTETPPPPPSTATPTVTMEPRTSTPATPSARPHFVLADAHTPAPEPKLAAPAATPRPTANPTPKPTPKPTAVPTQPPENGVTYTRDQVKQQIRDGWGGDDAKAIGVADCESSLNPRAASPSGTNLGLWQITQATWNAYGGSGDPRNHTPLEQTQIAWSIYTSRGWDAWPGCKDAAPEN